MAEFYCDKPDEVAQNGAMKGRIALIANGDPDALQFMWAIWNFTHLYDDLVDRDKAVTTPEAAKALADFVLALAANPFFHAHRFALLPLMLSSINRWCDGDDWTASEDPIKKQLSPAVRCGDVDLFLYVAMLTGGWDHMREMSKFREYDK